MLRVTSQKSKSKLKERESFGNEDTKEKLVERGKVVYLRIQRDQ